MSLKKHAALLAAYMAFVLTMAVEVQHNRTGWNDLTGGHNYEVLIVGVILQLYAAYRSSSTDRFESLFCIPLAWEFGCFVVSLSLIAYDQFRENGLNPPAWVMYLLDDLGQASGTFFVTTFATMFATYACIAAIELGRAPYHYLAKKYREQ